MEDSRTFRTWFMYLEKSNLISTLYNTSTQVLVQYKFLMEPVVMYGPVHRYTLGTAYSSLLEHFYNVFFTKEPGISLNSPGIYQGEFSIQVEYIIVNKADILYILTFRISPTVRASESR